MKISAVHERFILHWGEMGTRWGMNRSVAQIHALLYLTERPLSADEIVDTLDIARSNVSNSLKELQSWRLVRLVHVLGERRDHFTAEQDLWEMAMTIAEERKRRELDATLSMLRNCVLEAEGNDEVTSVTKGRLNEMLSFTELMVDWYEQVKRLPPSKLALLAKMGAGVAKLIGSDRHGNESREGPPDASSP